MNFNICLFDSRKSSGENKPLSWERFKAKLSEPTRTHETCEEFYKFPKERQTEIKDVGGFIAGYIKDGKRSKDSVESRSMIVLDADYAGEDFKEVLSKELEGYSYALYPTHKSRQGERKYRLIFPLSRDVSYEEYEPIARWFTSKLGIERFDPTTYQPERLMFLPSVSKDSEYDYVDSDGVFADPDLILQTYHDWRDMSCWEYSEKEKKIFDRDYEKKTKQDPLEKRGIIGAFCRAYSIQEAIETFLSDIYVETRTPNRYTYSNGTTFGGLVVYSDKFAYSHHSTDPACGELLNAFDLVRIHKYGVLDDDAKEGTRGDGLPSFKAMKKFAVELPEVKRQTITEKTDAYEDFSEELEKGTDWRTELVLNEKTGEILTSARNIKLILENDPSFKNKLAKDQMLGRPVKLARMPWDYSNDNQWKEEDDASLRNYLEEKYGIRGKDRVADALTEVFAKHSFHPVRDYLNSLEWDGVERLDTLLVDYLGAKDDLYVRTVTRKTFTACVKRVFEPGCKFDYMILMIGSQGKGKSHFLNVMGGKWFSDTITNINGKESYEALDGSWIVEMAEMTAAKRSDIEALKQYISKQSDKYRKAYERRVSDNPRQCVFFGTTNEYECLRDYTGNRRFWVVEVKDRYTKKDQFTELEAERDQIWAEAVVRYKEGEELFLRPDMEELAKLHQDAHTFRSTRWADIRNYLDRKIPYDWYDMTITDRIIWMDEHTELEGDIYRDKVCTKELWIECCGGNARNFGTVDQRDISSCLDFLGWTRSSNNKTVKGYGYQKVFLRPENERK